MLKESNPVMNAAQSANAGMPVGKRADPNGSGIALGHPVGAFEAINTVRALFELERVAVVMRLSRCVSAVGRALR